MPPVAIGNTKRDSPVTLPTARTCQQNRVGSDLGAARPELLPVDPEPSLDPVGAGPERSEIRPGFRLGEKLAPDVLAAQDPRKKAFFLLSRAQRHDRGAREVLADDVQTLRGAGSVTLLGEDRLCKSSHSGAAILFWPSQTGIASCQQKPLPLPPPREALVEIPRFGPVKLRKCFLKPATKLSSEGGFRSIVSDVHSRPLREVGCTFFNESVDAFLRLGRSGEQIEGVACHAL